MKLYVSNISFHTTETDLKEMFSRFGIVQSVNLIVDKLTGKTKRFGFVEMPSEPEAVTAMEKLNNKEIEGRMLSVTFARGRR